MKDVYQGSVIELDRRWIFSKIPQGWAEGEPVFWNDPTGHQRIGVVDEAGVQASHESSCQKKALYQNHKEPLRFTRIPLYSLRLDE